MHRPQQRRERLCLGDAPVPRSRRRRRTGRDQSHQQTACRATSSFVVAMETMGAARGPGDRGAALGAGRRELAGRRRCGHRCRPERDSGARPRTTAPGCLRRSPRAPCARAYTARRAYGCLLSPARYITRLRRPSSSPSRVRLRTQCARRDLSRAATLWSGGRAGRGDRGRCGVAVWSAAVHGARRRESRLSGLSMPGARWFSRVRMADAQRTARSDHGQRVGRVVPGGRQRSLRAGGLPARTV